MEGRPVDGLVGHRQRGEGTLGGVTHACDQINGEVTADVDGRPSLSQFHLLNGIVPLSKLHLQMYTQREKHVR